jgi:hypothetical protein
MYLARLCGCARGIDTTVDKGVAVRVLERTASGCLADAAELESLRDASNGFFELERPSKSNSRPIQMALKLSRLSLTMG